MSTTTSPPSPTTHQNFTSAYASWAATAPGDDEEVHEHAGVMMALAHVVDDLYAQITALTQRLYGQADVQPSQGDVEVIRRDVEALTADLASDKSTLYTRLYTDLTDAANLAAQRQRILDQIDAKQGRVAVS